ncbi:hypothetical protein CDAR_604541 [Caerostris darwini]|uniref:Uncharacterized protein n=1 Tax=Caerostris darwini TaxID=1538125 RepID=A0AAV4NAG3_9ARAC|nr:hypothetical protein CDAR_604541 [Caerostris darwini]
MGKTIGSPLKTQESDTPKEFPEKPFHPVRENDYKQILHRLFPSSAGRKVYEKRIKTLNGEQEFLTNNPFAFSHIPDGGWRGGGSGEGEK